VNSCISFEASEVALRRESKFLYRKLKLLCIVENGSIITVQRSMQKRAR